MNFETVAVIIVGLVLLAVWIVARKGCAVKAAAFEKQRQEAFDESNRILRELNKSFGAPEGTGLTGVMVDGEYKLVNVGHEERLKNDPAYAFGDKMAGITFRLHELEGALDEAKANGDALLVGMITLELDRLSKEAHSMLDEYQHNKGQA